MKKNILTIIALLTYCNNITTSETKDGLVEDLQYTIGHIQKLLKQLEYGKSSSTETKQTQTNELDTSVKTVTIQTKEDYSKEEEAYWCEVKKNNQIKTDIEITIHKFNSHPSIPEMQWANKEKESTIRIYPNQYETYFKIPVQQLSNNNINFVLFKDRIAFIKGADQKFLYRVAIAKIKSLPPIYKPITQ